MNNQSPASRKTTDAQRARWSRISGCRAIRTETLAYDGIDPVRWTLIEVKTAKASVALCALFGARAWCVREAVDARRYLPLYFFLRNQGGHLSLMACYSDHDMICSDRQNEDMIATDAKLFAQLARAMVTVRPRSKIIGWFVISKLREFAGLFPPKATRKRQQLIIDTARAVVGKFGKELAHLV